VAPKVTITVPKAKLAAMASTGLKVKVSCADQTSCDVLGAIRAVNVGTADISGPRPDVVGTYRRQRREPARKSRRS
jgi:hypothetical protein